MCLFVSAMSGFRVVFAVILVSKKRPMCLHLCVDKCYYLFSSEVIVAVTKISVICI